MPLKTVGVWELVNIYFKGYFVSWAIYTFLPCRCKNVSSVYILVLSVMDAAYFIFVCGCFDICSKSIGLYAKSFCEAMTGVIDVILFLY